MLQGYVPSNPFAKDSGIREYASTTTQSEGKECSVSSISNGASGVVPTLTNDRPGLYQYTPKAGIEPQGEPAKVWLMKNINKFADWVEQTKAGRSSPKTHESLRSFRDFDTVVALAAANTVAFNANPDLTILGFISKFGWRKEDFTAQEWSYILISIGTFIRFTINEVLQTPH